MGDIICMLFHHWSCNLLSIGAHVCLSMFVFPDSKVLKLHPILVMRHTIWCFFGLMMLFWASMLALEENSPAFITNTRLCFGTHMCTVPSPPMIHFMKWANLGFLLYTHIVFTSSWLNMFLEFLNYHSLHSLIVSCIMVQLPFTKHSLVTEQSHKQIDPILYPQKSVLKSYRLVLNISGLKLNTTHSWKNFACLVIRY
jgi:hypothetical protein